MLRFGDGTDKNTGVKSWQVKDFKTFIRSNTEQRILNMEPSGRRKSRRPQRQNVVQEDM